MATQATSNVPNYPDTFIQERLKSSKQNLETFQKLRKDKSKLPDATLLGIQKGKVQSFSLAKEFHGKRVVLLTIPFAFSEVSKKELQNMLTMHGWYPSVKIDQIACIVLGSIQSVMAWSRAIDSDNIFTMFSDPHGDYIEKIGFGDDQSKWGLGFCAQHACMLLDNRRIRHFNIEPDPKKIKCTTAQKIFGRCAEYEFQKVLYAERYPVEEDQKEEVTSPFKSPTGMTLLGHMQKNKRMEIGSKVPDTLLKGQRENTMEDLSLMKMLSDKRVLLFTFPFGFCKDYVQCLEKYVQNEKQLVTFDKIICLVTEMRYALAYWQMPKEFQGKVEMYSDWRHEFAVKSGLGCDGKEYGFVLQPSCMLVEKGVVKQLSIAKSFSDIAALDAGSLGAKVLPSAFQKIQINEQYGAV